MADLSPGDDALDRAIRDSLDGLLRALELEPLGDDRFRLHSEPGRFGRVFGGQLIAQALLAANATVVARPPHSLHAYFVATGVPERPVELSVERVRDGRSMCTRQVTVSQDGRTLLVAIASFHDNPDQPELADPAPPVPRPEELRDFRIGPRRYHPSCSQAPAAGSANRRRLICASGNRRTFWVGARPPGRARTG